MKMKKVRATRKKSVRVLAQGTFDVLHPGHVHYLAYAKKQGTHLTVIVARDANVKRFKGKLPACDERTRMQMVSALKAVDRAVIGGKGNILDKVIELKPDVIVLGYDQSADVKSLETKLMERGLRCRVIRAPAHKSKTYKSSLIKRKIVQVFQKTST
jgi:FAD synthetase